MTPEQHQTVVDVAKVVVNEYFDHYLSDVFPQQMDRLFAAHNREAEAHVPGFATHVKTCPMNRILWMVAGGSVVVGVVAGFVMSHWSQVVKTIF